MENSILDEGNPFKICSVSGDTFMNVNTEGLPHTLVPPEIQKSNREWFSLTEDKPKAERFK